MRSLAASQAYKKSATFRNVREQEADVFIRVNAVLRAARQGNALTRTKALADNDRLWITLIDLLKDPENPLPKPLRASLVSVGGAVQREASLPEPDFGFLIGINEQIAAGLSGT